MNLLEAKIDSVILIKPNFYFTVNISLTLNSNGLHVSPKIWIHFASKKYVLFVSWL